MYHIIEWLATVQFSCIYFSRNTWVRRKVVLNSKLSCQVDRCRTAAATGHSRVPKSHEISMFVSKKMPSDAVMPQTSIVLSDLVNHNSSGPAQ